MKKLIFIILLGTYKYLHKIERRRERFRDDTDAACTRRSAVGAESARTDIVQAQPQAPRALGRP